MSDGLNVGMMLLPIADIRGLARRVVEMGPDESILYKERETFGEPGYSIISSAQANSLERKNHSTRFRLPPMLAFQTRLL
jgi:hypothetical protein